MGTGKLPSRSDGFVMDDSWLNAIRSAICGDIVPRDTATGSPSSGFASLGPSDSFDFLRAFIGQGYWDIGDIKLHHSYNGTAGPGEGWMLCDGRTISEAAYDTEHGAGHWDTYVTSSALDGLKLPNFTGKYPVGAATTPADGSGVIPSVGNTSHLINMEHLHQWFRSMGGATADKGYDSAGDELTFPEGTHNKAGAITAPVVGKTTVPYLGSDFYTKKAMTANVSIQPDSIEFQFYMRII